MSDRPTPLTDKAERFGRPEIGQSWVWAGFARDLERQLAEAKESMQSIIGVEARVCGWQAIETAPRDGTQILGTWADTWAQGNPHVEAIQCGELGIWFYSYDGDGPPSDKPPTHWMPLPDPPKNC